MYSEVSPRDTKPHTELARRRTAAQEARRRFVRRSVKRYTMSPTRWFHRPFYAAVPNAHAQHAHAKQRSAVARQQKRQPARKIQRPPRHVVAHRRRHAARQVEDVAAPTAFTLRHDSDMLRFYIEQINKKGRRPREALMVLFIARRRTSENPFQRGESDIAGERQRRQWRDSPASRWCGGGAQSPLATAATSCLLFACACAPR